MNEFFEEEFRLVDVDKFVIKDPILGHTSIKV
jgi:hypothetical protein